MITVGKMEKKNWHEGAAIKLIRKCIDDNQTKLKFHFADRAEVQRIHLQRNLNKIKCDGKSSQVLRFFLLMQEISIMKQTDFGCGIYYCDADHESGSCNKNEAEKRFNKIYNQIFEVANSGLVKNSRMVLIPMVSLRMIESWLLSDETAFTKYYKCSTTPKLPSQPEIIWGEVRDPNSNHPKNFMIRVCKQCNNGAKPVRDDYIGIAENVDIDKLCKKCNISFKRFYDDFNTFVKNYEHDS